MLIKLKIQFSFTHHIKVNRDPPIPAVVENCWNFIITFTLGNRYLAHYFNDVLFQIRFLFAFNPAFSFTSSPSLYSTQCTLYRFLAIKFLYHEARHSPSTADAHAYESCINSLVNHCSNPSSFQTRRQNRYSTLVMDQITSRLQPLMSVFLKNWKGLSGRCLSVRGPLPS